MHLEASPKPARLLSLDAFRGYTVAAMILVNNPGSWSHMYSPLRHAPWHGCTPTDLIFPFFLFIVGVALPLAGHARTLGAKSPMTPRRGEVVRVLRRTLVLFLLGLLLSGFPEYDLSTLRFPGVLQRIAMCYLLAWCAVIFLRPVWLALVSLLILIGYWGAMMLIAVPNAETQVLAAGDLSPAGNLAGYLDRLLLTPAHMYRGNAGNPTDPEGLLSTLPATATVLLGALAGGLLIDRKNQERSSRALLLGSLAAIALGLLWSLEFPINKSLWTSSYVLFTAGCAGVVLWATHRLVDRRRSPAGLILAKPGVMLGVNAIAVFVASGLLARVLGRIRMLRGEGESAGQEPITLARWLYERLASTDLSEENASLTYALLNVALWSSVACLMWRRRWFVKV